VFGGSSSVMALTRAGTSESRQGSARTRLADAAPMSLAPATHAWLRLATSAALAAVLAGCSTPRAPAVRENLDTNTGATAIVLAQPIELVTDEGRGAQRDPFAFIAPVVIDRQGDKQRLLWVSVPQDNGPVAAVQVICNDAPLNLPSVRPDFAQLGLTRAPYKPSAPWSTQWYFPLPEPALRCLTSASHLAVASRLAQGTTEHFSAQPEQLRALADFATHDTPAH
jgi:hypothetical protein